MLRSIIISSIFYFFCTTAFAQKFYKYEIAFTPSIATTQFYGFALGADVRLEKYLDATNTLIFSTGVSHFFETVKAYKYTVLPIKVGIKNNVTTNFYAAVEVGVGIGVGLAENSGTGFIWSSSLGYSIKNSDISLQYQDFVKYISTKQFGIRFAYYIKH